jgi:hypothetical protein
VISLVVPFRGDGGQRDRVWEWCRAHWGAMLPGAEVILTDSGHEPFHRAASINRGVEAARGDKVIVADADTVISNVIGLYVALEGPHWLIGYASERYFTLDAEQTDRLLTRSPRLRLPGPPPRALGITSWSGALGFRRERFVPFDERHHGWGYEDVNFAMAAETLLGPPARVDGYALHLWHERGLEWSQPYIQENVALWHRYQAASGDVVAMQRLVDERGVSDTR